MEEINNSRLSSEEEALLSRVLESEHQEIPRNSPTLNVDAYTSRFSSAVWYEEAKKHNIILAGLGGIGSWTTLLLSRLHPSHLLLYDDDNVDASNMSGQLYNKYHVGLPKTNVAAGLCADYGDYYDYQTYNHKYNETSANGDIMICGFDNMKARKIFYKRWKDNVKWSNKGDRCLLIDGRLAAEEFQVFAIQGNDERAMKEYEDKWLFSDEEAEETICSYKQTSFMANMIASVMTNIYVNFITNLCDPIIKRDIPFFISYDASTMFTKVVM